MRIGVLSDIHDNLWALPEALARLSDCEALLCLGDLCAPFTITEIAQRFSGPVHLVWGNNDGDKLLIARNAEAAGNVTIHGELAELELGGRSIAMTHYPNIGQALTRGETYDLVCHGHSHQRSITQIGRTTLLNPGEVMGRLGVRSVAVYDTVSARAEIIEF
ncbi:MAG TPA: metallophosphoesterase family protein [Chloroflexi bacterium]|jgi:putative phosphoesterase|nr:metallophosphoesterase family protein [Chloroflexota bacterium]